MCDIIKQTHYAGRSGGLMVSPLVSGYRIKRSEFKPWLGNLCCCFEQGEQTTNYSVQSRVDPAATTTILPYVCLGVWCFSLFIVVYIGDVIYRKICVILIGCFSLTNFRAHSLTNQVYRTGQCLAAPCNAVLNIKFLKSFLRG